jgi:hypothetical protein
MRSGLLALPGYTSDAEPFARLLRFDVLPGLLTAPACMRRLQHNQHEQPQKHRRDSS